MSDDEALVEAQRRWGSRAFVSRIGTRYEVGKLRITDSKRRVLGWSLENWDKAFQRAEQPK